MDKTRLAHRAERIEQRLEAIAGVARMITQAPPARREQTATLGAQVIAQWSAEALRDVSRLPRQLAAARRGAAGKGLAARRRQRGQ
jgi:hypothetical protein